LISYLRIGATLVNLNEVKAQFSKYIELVEGGDTVVVCKRNVPVAEIRPITQKEKKVPELGWGKSMKGVAAGFKDLTEDELASCEGDDRDPLQKYAPKRRRTRK
jgi:antitoxin (DNA-binding transcriptional repressor) of toxin-antitoxin stability system